MSAVESHAGGSMAPMDLCRRLNCVLQRKVSPLQRETKSPEAERRSPNVRLDTFGEIKN